MRSVTGFRENMKTIAKNIDVYIEASSYFLHPAHEVTSRNDANKLIKVKYTKTLDALMKNNHSFLHPQIFRSLYGFPKNQFMAVKWVLATSKLSGVDRLIAATIAGFYNTKLGYAYPNQQQVAKICGVSERTVTTAITQMKARGEWLITPVQVAPYEKAVSNRYYLLPPAGYGTCSQAVETSSLSLKMSQIDMNTLYDANTKVGQQLYNSFKLALANSRLASTSHNLVPNPTSKIPFVINTIVNHYKPLPQYLVFSTGNQHGSSKKRIDYDRKLYEAFVKNISS